jgi:hypothetical protein
MQGVISEVVKLKNLLLFSLTLFAAYTNACSCGELSARNVMESEYGESVFIAFIKQAEAISNNGVYSRVIAKFEVEKIFKGADSLPSTIFTELDAASCGLPIEVGTKYILVSNKSGYVHYCSSRQIVEYPHDPILEKYLKEFEGFLYKSEITKD